MAAYEAAGFVVRHHIELSGLSAERIVAVGGGTQSAAWMQALADTTGLAVDVSAEPYGAALGAAYHSRVTVGLEADTSQARRWGRVARRVEPPAFVRGCRRRPLPAFPRRHRPVRFSVTYPLVAGECSPEFATRWGVLEFARAAEEGGGSTGLGLPTIPLRRTAGWLPEATTLSTPSRPWRSVRRPPSGCC